MSGTRIMVVQMKQLIKVGIIVLIGLILIVALVIYLLPKSAETASKGYAPGTYTAQIVLQNQPVDVAVTVNAKEITDVQLLNMQANQELFYPLFKPTMDELAKQIVRYQTTSLATSPENAVTSRILLNAVDAALKQAQ